jgi:hypothetical protein
MTLQQFIVEAKKRKLINYEAGDEIGKAITDWKASISTPVAKLLFAALSEMMDTHASMPHCKALMVVNTFNAERRA